jgi:phage virion morphogenesis protein
MADFIQIEDGPLNQEIDRLAGKLADLTPANTDIGEYMLLSTRGKFDRQEGPDGRPWTALSPAYAKQKAQNPRALKGILTLTGTMRDTISYRATPSAVVIGSNQVYAPIQQFGGRGIPPRPFLEISSADRAEISEILRGHLGL